MLRHADEMTPRCMWRRPQSTHILGRSPAVELNKPVKTINIGR